MKNIIIILVVIGVLGSFIIGGCTMFIGGCVSLTASAMSSSIPDYATKDYFIENYADDIRKISKNIHNADIQELSESPDSFHEDIIAVLKFNDDVSSFDDDHCVDIYKKHSVKKTGSSSLMNGIGVSELTVNHLEETYLVREINVDGIEYWICFVDRNRINSEVGNEDSSK